MIQQRHMADMSDKGLHSLLIWYNHLCKRINITAVTCYTKLPIITDQRIEDPTVFPELKWPPFFFYLTTLTLTNTIAV